MANVSCPHARIHHVISVKYMCNLSGALFGTDEENFSGFCFVVGVFLLLFLVPRSLLLPIQFYSNAVYGEHESKQKTQALAIFAM